MVASSPQSVTSSNVVLMLAVTGIFTAPVQIQGFAPDQAFNGDSVERAETMIGVDGFMAAGYIPALIPLSVTLLPSSPSVAFFETWNAQQLALQDLFIANGTINYPSIGKKYTLSNGVLQGFSPLPDAKKVLQPRVFKIIWGNISVANQ
jgi:hypothetical protein